MTGTTHRRCETRKKPRYTSRQSGRNSGHCRRRRSMARCFGKPLICRIVDEATPALAICSSSVVREMPVKRSGANSPRATRACHVLATRLPHDGDPARRRARVSKQIHASLKRGPSDADFAEGNELLVRECLQVIVLKELYWSRRSGSNRRPADYEGVAAGNPRQLEATNHASFSTSRRPTQLRATPVRHISATTSHSGPSTRRDPVY